MGECGYHVNGTWERPHTHTHTHTHKYCTSYRLVSQNVILDIKWSVLVHYLPPSPSALQYPLPPIDSVCLYLLCPLLTKSCSINRSNCGFYLASNRGAVPLFLFPAVPFLCALGRIKYLMLDLIFSSLSHSVSFHCSPWLLLVRDKSHLFYCLVLVWISSVMPLAPLSCTDCYIFYSTLFIY